MRNSLRLLPLVLVLLPAIAVLPESGGAKAATVERPTEAIAKSAIRKQQLAFVAKTLPGTSARVVFLSFQLGPTRPATKADRIRTLPLPAVGTSVTPFWTKRDLRLAKLVTDDGERMRVCWWWRTRLTGILWKRNGKWTWHNPSGRQAATRTIDKGLC